MRCKKHNKIHCYICNHVVNPISEDGYSSCGSGTKDYADDMQEEARKTIEEGLKNGTIKEVESIKFSEWKLKNQEKQKKEDEKSIRQNKSKLSIWFFLVIIFTVLLSTLYYNKANAKTVILAPYEKIKVKQFGLNWCWAAVLESFYKYENKQITQFDILKGFSKKDLTYLIETKDSIEHGIFKSEFEALYLKEFEEISNFEIVPSIEQSLPVIMLRNNHVELIYGYSGKYFHAMNPAREKPSILKFEDLRYLHEEYYHNFENAKFYRKKLTNH